MMKNLKYISISIFILLVACTDNKTSKSEITLYGKKLKRPHEMLKRFIPVAEHFDYPLGYPDFECYHDAKPFGVNGHLGADFNGIEGGDSDLGDTIKSIGNGVVTYSDGCLLNIMHRTIDKKHFIITSIYYHCDTLFVSENEIVKGGQVIALLGKKDTQVAHLHFEIATDTNMVGGFYGADTTGFMNPMTFIKTHR
ncbi:MAG: M23 family metallopeptidase [Bacteroidales bacterium]|nr:M23 family metallopeptidase [Bacteroidales bacterium]MBN2756552.1 M23 family metallopeptidase [Bacteroidales bacterium]